MNNREEYINLCTKEPTINIFSQYWWLDAVCGNSLWDVVLYKSGGNILGALTFFKKKQFKVLNTIQLPLQTQNMGVWIKPDDRITSVNNLISYQNKIMDGLIEQLPPFDYFSQQFSYSITNWLPFYWAGFNCTPKYTYIIPDISDADKVFNSFSNNIKSNIKIASKNLLITVDTDYYEFYNFHKKCLLKRNEIISYPFALFESMYKSSSERNKGAILSAHDAEGNRIASLFFIWDQNSAYHMITPIDPHFKSLHAMPLLIYEAIKYLSGKTNVYDFEGSMIKAVEASYRKYGTTPKTYFSITKTNSRLLKLALLFRKKN